MTSIKYFPIKKLSKKLEKVNRTIRTNGISSDIDGVEHLSAPVALASFNNAHKTNYKLDDLTNDRFAMVGWAAKIPEIKNPMEEAMFHWNNSEVLIKLDAEEGALELSKYLHKKQINMRRITTRPSRALEPTLTWYKVNEPWIDPSLITIQRDNDMISKEFKLDMIKKYSISYHLEDAPEEAEVIAEKFGVINILIPQPWNKDYKPKSSKVISFDKANNEGLTELGLMAEELARVPKLLKAYYILAEYILSSN